LFVDPCNLLLMGEQTADCFTPPGPLDYCTTYYWQVIEVNDLHPDSLWEGDVWSFTTASSLPGDIDCNGVVNWGDLSCVAGYWLASGPDDDGPNGIPDECDSYATDIAPDGGDGIVNFLDYAVVAGHWLEEWQPECWGNPRQCHGDIDGELEGSPFGGYYYVGDIDLGILTAAYGTSEGEPGYDPCADTDHDGDVDAEDLAEFNTWYKVKEDPHGPGVPADCTPDP